MSLLNTLGSTDGYAYYTTIDSLGDVATLPDRSFGNAWSWLRYQ
jgi:hypothetical protein